jgi:hypothetical protein
MVDRIHSMYRKTLGTDIHEFAASQILLCQPLTSVKSVKENLQTFIFRKYYDKDTESITPNGKSILNELGYLPKEVFSTTKSYICDGIKFKMTPEQRLEYHKVYFHGTADTISFWNDILRIHDLKTGNIPAHIEQLKVYAALFCLEYDITPSKIQMELRIYQNNEIVYCKPSADDILPIMNVIRERTKELEKIFY